MKLKFFLLLSVFSLLGISCASDGGTEQVPVSGGSSSEIAESIVSLSPTATEILFAIGAGEQVIAVDDQSNFPSSAPMTDLSGYTPNVEEIAAYDPDLVVTSYDPGDLVDGLNVLGIKSLIQGAAMTLEDTYFQITELGELTGRSEEAEKLNEEIQSTVSSVAPFSGELTYYHEVDNTLFTTTSKTFLGQLYELMGLVNIADPADEAGFGWPQLSSEFIVDSDPDLIFLADGDLGESAQTVSNRPGWSSMQAVAEGRIIVLDTDIASRWGPRVVDFLDQVKSEIELLNLD
ncbi:MAG: ABC transporter substrate-binding protein [Acidimicrobiales bacterium]|nr:ABC transporter substrate-binding protein [Acidimicrobiales bacterium]MEC7908791.1 ABC transporter substrate-binding protein [Actinomycetota bacterium]|tara:strand:- start:4599 stop:5468 length:870 start_codon:yes stop_codon:yes gene_type:complete